MDLKEQLYVCTVAECKSITKASKVLYISQPALSTYITKLENTMGTKLFNRIKNDYILTYAGELYIEKAKKMLELKREFEIGLDNILNSYNERIRIGVQTRRSPYIVPQILYRCRKELPNVKIVIRESNNKGLEKLLNENELDIIVYSCNKRKSNMEYEHILDDELLLALPSDDKLIRNCKIKNDNKYVDIDIDRFKGETFILPHIGQSLRDTAEILFQNENFHPKKIIEIRNIETAMQLVSKNFGIGFNRRSYIRHMEHIANISYCNISSWEYSSEIVISYPKNIYISSYMSDISRIIKDIVIKSC